MNMTKALNAPINQEVRYSESEVFRNQSTSRTFDYELNDKAAKAKLLKATKRIPLEIEENTTSSNLIFSSGGWYHVVLPSMKYFSDVKGEKSCKIGDYTVKVGGVKQGKDNTGKQLELGHKHDSRSIFAKPVNVVPH